MLRNELVALAKPGLSLINVGKGEGSDINVMFRVLLSGQSGGIGIVVMPEDPSNIGRTLIWTLILPLILIQALNSE